MAERAELTENRSVPPNTILPHVDYRDLLAAIRG